MDFFQMFPFVLGVVAALGAIYCLVKLVASLGMFGNVGRFLLGNNYAYDDAADTEVSLLLNKIDNGEIVPSLGNYTITAGNKAIWIGNYPYAYGHIYGINARVSLKTFKRVRKLHIELASK